MIPTLILFGVVAGRWWRLALAVAALLWPVLLVATGAMGVGPELLGAAVLAVANTAVGVLVHQGVRWAVRSVRRSGA
ncbi:hypothetical protein [Micromonospora costi]|uniref:Uncharacterized protein n=1 Tax=Micromonospora costi TaxID=1530042 RepID=A0A3B0A4J0_9ACTN|nr:hypothetical protein [Micromonospora costi]RKN54227.1 hypothetical protein D7193_19620 [Micromonospora costi]